MLDSEEWRNSLGFHLIHNLVINRLHEHFLKSEVEEASPNFENLQAESNKGTFLEIIIRL